MTGLLERTIDTTTPARAARTPAVRRFVGGFYLVMAGINAGLALADPHVYRHFADGASWGFVTRAWRDVVMAEPRVWIGLLAAGEVVIGTLLLRGGRAARVGWGCVLAFQVLLMSFGFGFWLWSLPVLAALVPVVRRDWPLLADAAPPPDVPAPRRPVVAPSTAVEPSPAELRRTPVALWSTVVLAVAVVGASLYGLLADDAYRSLPDATVLGARAQDACSIVVAALLLAGVARPVLSPATRLVRLGLLAYLVYSYLIYVTGVPMNRVFLVYVVILVLAGWGLVPGLVQVGSAPPPTTASPRLARGTGWLLVATAVLFSALWLSTLLPFAIGGSHPDPEGVGGTPYPVFWLDLALVLPLIAGVGVLLLRGHRCGPAFGVVALIKIVTLFTALWAGPVVALATDEAVHLGPDAGPSLLLLASTTGLAVVWLRSFRPPPVSSRRAPRR